MSTLRILSILPLFATALFLRAADDGFVPLFNGTDLSGWKVVVENEGLVDLDEQELFAVEEGVIHVYPTAKEGSSQPFGGIVTEKSYRNYHLRLQFKWGEKKFAPRATAVRDAGVLIHLASEPKVWPTSIECQIQEGDCGDLWIIGETRASSPVHRIQKGYHDQGELETRGAGLDRGDRFARGYCREQPGWNTIEVIVRGQDAIFLVNGHQVNEAVRMRLREEGAGEWQWQPLTEGPIFLQAEGSELFYRQIEIRPLDN